LAQRLSGVARFGTIAAFAAMLVPAPAAYAATPGRCTADVAAYDVAVPGHPFATVTTPDEQHAFVSMNSANPRSLAGIAVLECARGRYRFVHVVGVESQPAGMVMTHDGKLLIVSDEDFVTFVDVQRAIAGGDAIVGYLQDLDGDDSGAVYVNVTPDDRFAFISDEGNQTITVLDLARARANGFARTAIVGTVPTGRAPVALTFTADGRYLLTTSQRALPSDGFPISCKPEGQDPAKAVPTNPPGEILTIDVAKAQTDPAHSIVSRTPAGCSPVRLSLSPDGATAWVTARNSNAVLGFSVAKLIAGDRNAQIANVAVGTAPVPVIASPDGRYVLAGNSNRFGLGAGGNQTLTVLDARAALSGGAARLGEIAVGKFPRELTRTASGSTLFLSNFDSNTVTVFDATRLGELIR
jgi:DNA-binding beta-propeller fold protein YncE